MENAIKVLVTTFLKASNGKDNLNTKSFKRLVSSNFGSLMEQTDDSSAVKEMQQGLDENQDGKVSFQEYLTLIGYLANSLSQRKSGASAGAS